MKGLGRRILSLAQGDDTMADLSEAVPANLAGLDIEFRNPTARGHVPLAHIAAMKSIAELRARDADVAERAGVVFPSAHVERRKQPRPRPQHVEGLAEELSGAFALLESTDPVIHARAVGTVARVANALTNLAEAMKGASR